MFFIKYKIFNKKSVFFFTNLADPGLFNFKNAKKIKNKKIKKNAVLVQDFDIVKLLFNVCADIINVKNCMQV